MPYDVTDKTARLALAYGEHTIHSGNGKLTRHYARAVGSELQVTAQLALAAAPLSQIVRLAYDGADIAAQYYRFHKNSAGEAPGDDLFPGDVPHPGASWLNFQLPVGMAADNQPDKAVARVKCLEIADYNAAGGQVGFGYYANAARIAVDGIKRMTGNTNLVEFGAFDEYKAWCDEPITVTRDGAAVQVPRFETHVFFQPPFSLNQFLDRICQLTCSDWQWRRGKIRFMPSVARPASFNFDLSKVALNFRFQALTNKSRPNGVRVNYRSLDDALLKEADPVVVRRQHLLDQDGGIENFLEINGGVCRRDQAERLANYWAKVRCDLLDFGYIKGSWAS